MSHKKIKGGYNKKFKGVLKVVICFSFHLVQGFKLELRKSNVSFSKQFQNIKQSLDFIFNYSIEFKF
jgi:hypothetical protein